MIFDGPDKLAMKIGEIFGHLNNRKWKSISSSGMMFINFKKEFDMGKVQLKASIKYRKFIPDCQTWLEKFHLRLPIRFLSLLSYFFELMMGFF